MNPKPTIAIVGRPNVGKSAIFNRLAGRRISIVHDQPGVTRDRISAPAAVGPFAVNLIDTGGIGSTVDTSFTVQVETEAHIAIETSDLILFVVDAREGITTIDQSLAALLRRAATPVLLLINKADSEGIETIESDFASLGFSETLCVSAAHGRRFAELATLIARQLEGLSLPTAWEIDAADEDRVIEIALVGKPNVGKSSLVNAILEDKRTIVSDIAGTTRDAIDVPYSHGGKDYTLIDTAGIRARTSRDSSVEAFSVMRSERSIRRADVCLLVIDSSTGITAQDRRIARLILDARKPSIILLNKFDLYHPEGPFKDRIALLEAHDRRELFFLHYAPFVAVSALQGKFISKIFQAIDDLRGTIKRAPTTGVLNRILQGAIEKTPPPSTGGRRFNLLYATARKTDPEHTGPMPIPEYLLFVNRANLLTRSYQRYLEGELRSRHSFEGLPIIFEVRAKQKFESASARQTATARKPAKPSGARKTSGRKPKR